MLFEALIELIQEKRWDKIRVQDLLDRTKLGRSTFYAHYDNKYDLLTSAMPSALTLLDDEGELNLLPLFEHVEEMQPVLLPIMTQPLLVEVSESFHRQLIADWEAHLSGLAMQADRVSFTAQFLTGGLLTIALRWAAGGCDRPAAEVCADYERVLDAVLDDALSPQRTVSVTR